MTATYAELPCSLQVSNYKALTPTLLTAQQSYALRPYFDAKIIDDTVQPNQVISSSIAPFGNSSSVTAPDGNVLSVGLDASGNVVFYKGLNLHAGTWDSSQILQAVGGTFNGFFNRYCINVSEYINGTYAIHICYFSGFVNSASGLIIKGWLSTDGGLTFTAQPNFTPSGMASNLYNGSTGFNLGIAAMKPRLVAGVLNVGFFFTKTNSNAFVTTAQLGYDIWYAFGLPASLSEKKWGKRYVNSNDWTLQTLDTAYFNNIDYVVFSGNRNFLDTPNLQIQGGSSKLITIYGVWITGLSQIASGNNDNDSAYAGDLWLPPSPIQTSIGISNTNQNSFILPTISVVGDLLQVFFPSITVDSIVSANGTVSLHTTLMNAHSINGRDFSYPAIVTMADGSELVQAVYGGMSYVAQGVYRYLIGTGIIWEFIQNNIVAEITNDVVQYTIADTAGQPSSISLQLANQNNDWVGTAPTSPGASAIAGNRKVVLQEGYYNANGVPETVPRNVFFIDDIHQNVSNLSNDVTITGRDLYKKLKTTITRWAYTWFGPFFYQDAFDGTTLSNWNQQTGTWAESSNSLTLAATSGGDDVIMLSTIPNISYGSVLGVTINGSASGTVYVYAYYFDSNNWLRFSYKFSVTHATKITKCVGGVQTDLYSDSSSTLGSSGAQSIFIRQYDFYKFNFFYSSTTGGNTLAQSYQLINSGAGGEFDLTTDIIAMQSQRWGVGMGATGYTPVFTYFQYTQFNFSNSISNLIKALGAKANIFLYNIENIFAEDFYAASDFTPDGSNTTFNRVLKVVGGSSAAVDEISNTQQLANGEISFVAKCLPQAGYASPGFAVLFRVNAPSGFSSAYRLRAQNLAGGPGSTKSFNVVFERYYLGTWYQFPSCPQLLSFIPVGGLNFDMTKKHLYRIVFSDGWMFAFIDSVMVASWNDNNITSAFLTNGYYGFEAEQQSTLYVSSAASTAFWKQNSSFSLNAGDDIESGLLSIVQSVRSWVFSDIFGYLKAIFLNSDDPSTYTYENQLYVQGVDNSDKEYVSQVTVYGTGVSATARNTDLMAGVPTRELVIVDYTILTVSDAQNRANNELINSNQYRFQYNPKQVMNVGAELFDAVTIIDTGNNSSGVDSITRVYAQKMTTGGSGNGNEYSLELDTGTL